MVNYEQESQSNSSTINLLEQGEELNQNEEGQIVLKTRHIDGVGDLEISLLPELGDSGYEDDNRVWVLNDKGLEMAVNPHDLIKQGFKTLSLVISDPATDIVDVELKHASSEKPFSSVFKISNKEPYHLAPNWWVIEGKVDTRDIMAPLDKDLLRKTKITLMPVPLDI